MEYIRGEICGVENCRATQYYLEAGLWFCKNGHIREGRVQVHHEDDDDDGQQQQFGTQGTTTRRRREREEIPQRVFRGEKAFELYLQCYQLLLRKQSFWLVERQKLPAELETIIRDLWALRLQKLQVTSDVVALRSENNDGGDVRYYSSTSEEEVEEEEGAAHAHDNEVEEKEASSDTELPVLRETLCLCYIGSLLLRLPLSLGDFYREKLRARWAVQGDIVYVRAIRSIPRDMRSHLPPEYHAALDHRTATLQPDELHKDTTKLALFYQKHFGLVFQAINTPLILFRYINDLALPLNTYHAVNKISKWLKCSFTFQNSPVKLRRLSFPEIELMSLLLVAVKVSLCFDQSNCRPRTDAEPAALVVDWNVWGRAFREANKETQSLCLGDEMNVTEDDIFRMNGEQLDQYLDWYERTWAEDGGTILPESLLKLFPTVNRRASENNAARGLAPENELGPLHRKPEILGEALKVQTAISDKRNQELGRKEGKDNAFQRPGSQYKRYRKVEDLPQYIKPLFEAATKLIGVRLETLVSAVFQTELKLEKRTRGEYKRKGVISTSLEGDGLSHGNEEKNQGVDGGDGDHSETSE